MEVFVLDCVKIIDSTGADINTGIFNDVVEYACPQSAVFVDNTRWPNPPYIRTCNYDTTWSGTSDVGCGEG